MSLEAFLKPINSFDTRAHTFKIKAISWYLHEVKRQDRFSPADINRSLDELHLPRPSNVSSLLNGMTLTSPKQVLRDSKGYRLSASSRDEMATLLPVRHSAAEATALLKALESRVTRAHQKVFLAETLVCFTNEAYRSSIVMAWNLAYSHVCDVIFDTGLAAFNAQLKVARPKLDPVAKKSDFEDYKESVVIEVARGAGLLSAATAKTLTEKLGKRNTSAHPSSTIVTSVTAEEVIHDLVENILLRPVL